jgi:OOP family OmpA-OmpF porin
VDGLDPADPANRRIEFSVLVKPRLVPTPIDTPAAR